MVGALYWFTQARRIPANAIQSDFVKNSSSFRGSGVHLGSHFEGAFGAQFSQIAKPPSRFQCGFVKSSMQGKTAKTPKPARTHAFGNDSGPRTLPKAKKLSKRAPARIQILVVIRMKSYHAECNENADFTRGPKSRDQAGNRVTWTPLGWR